jgi:hypothetical protein
MSVSQASDCTPLSLRGTAGGIPGAVTAWLLAGILLLARPDHARGERIKMIAGGHTIAPRKHWG